MPPGQNAVVQVIEALQTTQAEMRFALGRAGNPPR